MNVLNWVKQKLSLWPKDYQYDTLPPEEMRAAMEHPFLRHCMVKFSRDEYKRNPYYKSVINKLTNHVIGPTPAIIGLSENEEANNRMEDLYLEWSQFNGIGKSFRLLRRDAALTGIGIMIPYPVTNGLHPIKLGYKVYGKDALRTPMDAKPEDRIFDGIQFNSDWEPVKFHFIKDKLEDRRITGRETVAYNADDVIYWSAGFQNGVINPIPECAEAFTIYPYIRRFLQAYVEGEEFKVSFPMALELNPQVYLPSQHMKDNPPYGAFEYTPKMVPTLPPGTELKGLPTGTSSTEQTKLVRLVASAAALCIDMPANLALGDSSNSNMSVAQVDMQPWKIKVQADRFDLHPVFRKTFNEWYKRAVLIEEFLPTRVRRKYSQFFPHSYAFDNLFQHPDPQKNANARATDLSSGSTTLSTIYAEKGKNAKRELQREADLLGISYEDLTTLILMGRTNGALELIGDEDGTE